MRLGITRNGLRTRKLWIYKSSIFSEYNGPCQSYFGPYIFNHEEALTKYISNVKEDLLGVHIKKKNKPGIQFNQKIYLVYYNWPNRHQLRKVLNQINFVWPKPFYEVHEIIITIQKTSKTFLAAPAPRGLREFSYNHTCHIWRKPTWMSNISFPFKPETWSALIQP